ncbi:hypothetical protein [Tsukamurella paurometabola]|uniref:Uncharacterized protein n=1 Tax=Tsukamurella paurometabola TaxID=2061 RepID=A0ABS5NDY7_TSUPA|nr:hypothetical protein [Tsukamurella paurometabola]MBS4102448.1 hypothetical protein [Tsukamurella paurometabola]
MHDQNTRWDVLVASLGLVGAVLALLCLVGAVTTAGKVFFLGLAVLAAFSMFSTLMRK